MSRRRKKTRRIAAKVSPLEALRRVRKPLPPPTRREDDPGRYRRSRERRSARAVIVDEIDGC